MMPGMIQRAHGTRTANTQPPALKPARAKASRPYAPGMKHYERVMLTIAGGDKGTGKQIARTYYAHTPTDKVKPEVAELLRTNVEAVANRHGYTVTHWPKELRP